MSQKYNIGSRFDNSNSNDRHKIVFEVTNYEKTLCDDKDDHYEIFDGDSLRTWIKQSNLDRMVKIN
jgi:hypothetical protein